jgi:hypothetical protein
MKFAKNLFANSKCGVLARGEKELWGFVARSKNNSAGEARF